MRSAIIKGLIPIFVFLAFAEGSLLGLELGASGGLLILIILNWNYLRKKFFFDWALLTIFLLLLLLLSFPKEMLIHYNLALAYCLFSISGFFTLLIKRPFIGSYFTTKVDPIFWKSLFSKIISKKLTLVWSVIFFLCAVSTFLFENGWGNLLWLVEIIPTGLMIIGLFITIIAPDNLHRRILRLGGVASLPSISEVKSLKLPMATIGYRSIGKGPVILLLNGFMMNMHNWDADFIKRLSQHYRVFLFDYPGMGYSLGESFSWDESSFADLLQNIIIRLNLKPIGIIGYSMGGFIAQAFAKQYPKLVSSLMLISIEISALGVNHRFDDMANFSRNLLTKPTPSEFEKSLSFLFPEEVIPRIKDRIIKQWTAAAFEGDNTPSTLEKPIAFIQHWLEINDPWKLFSKNIPTLVMMGEKDMMASPQNLAWIKKQPAPIQTINYPDSGHGIIYQYPIDAAEQIEAFLRNLSEKK